MFLEITIVIEDNPTRIKIDIATYIKKSSF